MGAEGARNKNSNLSGKRTEDSMTECLYWCVVFLIYLQSYADDRFFYFICKGVMLYGRRVERIG